MQGRREHSQQEEHILDPVEDAHDVQNATSRPLLKARASTCVEKLAIKLEDSDVDIFNALREQGDITDDSHIEEQAIFKDEKKQPTIKPGDGGDGFRNDTNAFKLTFHPTEPVY